MWFISEATSEDKDALSECEPPHDKTNKIAFEPNEDSDQPGHPPSLSESSQCAQWVAEDPMFLHADSEDSDQTGRMHRLRTQCFFTRTAKTLIRLGGCTG